MICHIFIERTLLIIGMLCIILFSTIQANACYCGVPEVVGFISKGNIIPSNSSGLLWYGEFDGNRDSNETLPVKITTDNGKILPVEYEPFYEGSEDFFPGLSLWLFRPRGGFEEGKSYVFTTKVLMELADPKEEKVLVMVSNKSAKSPPRPVSLIIGEQRTDEISIPNHLSCTEVITAVQVTINMDLPDGLETFRDQLFFETIIDGKLKWYHARHHCELIPPGSSSQGKGIDLLFRGCNYGWGLEPGPHTVEMRASLPGTQVRVVSLPVTIELNCSKDSIIVKREHLLKQVQVMIHKEQYEKALPIAKNLLALSEEYYGKEHMNTAESIKWLGMVYFGIGNLVEAESLSMRVLAIYEKVLGPGDFRTEIYRDDLSDYYIKRGEFEKVERLYLNAVAINEQVNGIEHVNTAESLDKLAGIYRSTGNTDKASILYKRALAIYGKISAPEDGETVTGLINEAGSYQHRGYTAKAVILYERALALTVKGKGSKNNDVDILNNLADLYQLMENHNEAVVFYNRLIELRPKDIRAIIGRGTSWGAIGNCGNAISDYSRALILNPDNVNVLNNMAWIKATCKDPAYRSGSDAVEFALKVINIKRTPEFLDTLGAAYAEVGDFNKAIEIQKEAVNLCGDCPNLKNFQENLGTYRSGKTYVQHQTTTKKR